MLRIITLTIFLLTLATVPSLATEKKHDEFGDSYFTGTPHPGFEDPEDYKTVIGIEPAGGEESDAVTEEEMENDQSEKHIEKNKE